VRDRGRVSWAHWATRGGDCGKAEGGEKGAKASLPGRFAFDEIFAFFGECARFAASSAGLFADWTFAVDWTSSAFPSFEATPSAAFLALAPFLRRFFLPDGAVVCAVCGLLLLWLELGSATLRFLAQF
jgi:hypothetical protein